MAFNMAYSFEGHSRNRPEQNLSGASKKFSRDTLLQRSHEDRRKREENRLKLHNSQILQAHIKSYLVRKSVKAEQRYLFDYTSDESIEELLSKLLFFYDFQCDNIRLCRMNNLIQQKKMYVMQNVNQNPRLMWLIKRWLVLCLRNCHQTNFIEMITCLQIFADNIHIIEFLVGKLYYKYLRRLIDMTNDSQLLDQLMWLVHRPFNFLSMYTSEAKNVIFSEFITYFMQPTLTRNVKFLLIPKLKQNPQFPYANLIQFMAIRRNHLNATNSLLYSVLALQTSTYQPTKDTICVLAALTSHIHQLNLYTNVHNVQNDSDDDDDENVYIDHINAPVEMGDEEVLVLTDFLNIMNKPVWVQKHLHVLNMRKTNNMNDEIMESMTILCHNLLLGHSDAIRKFLLLYKLGLNGDFINQLWQQLKREHCLENAGKSSTLISWKSLHEQIIVFCNLFTFYTETLTDRDNSDTSQTFSQIDLYSMSHVFISMAIDLIDSAFPLCRSSAVPPTQCIIYFFTSCLNFLKMLYMLDMRFKFCPVAFWTSRKLLIQNDLLRKDYLSKHIRPFYGLVTDGILVGEFSNLFLTFSCFWLQDGTIPPLSTIEQRSLAILQQLPFLISFNTRVLFLLHLCRFSIVDNEYLRLHHDILGDNIVIIRRTHLYEDAFEKLRLKSDNDLKHKVRIQFINAIGLKEAGVDGGGIFKEFINEIVKTAFDPNRGFFLLTADNTLYPNPNVHSIVANCWDHYYFIGRLIGKALFENILVELPLAEFFLAKLLVERASAHYLQSLDPILYRNLLYLRDYSGDVSDLGLDFTVINNDLGETRIIELKPNGRNITVTNENRLEYIQRLADLKLNVQLSRQCMAFREGLNSMVPLLWLQLFNYNELQVIIGGDTQEIDLSDLRAHTIYAGEFSADHPTVTLFWQVLHKFTDNQRRMLLKFVTSCSRPPLLGFKELNPQFCIHAAGDEDRMPTASTCLNLLKLPIIKDEDVLKTKLLAAIEQLAGFELS